MLSTLQRYKARERSGQTERGFTLIELLIVIVVLGILAAVTVFALSGVTAKSAQGACTSDASATNTAIVAFTAATGAAPVNVGALVPAYLQTAPTSSHYTIATGNNTLGDGIVTVTPTGTGAQAAAGPWSPTVNGVCASVK